MFARSMADMVAGQAANMLALAWSNDWPTTRHTPSNAQRGAPRADTQTRAIWRARRSRLVAYASVTAARFSDRMACRMAV